MTQQPVAKLSDEFRNDLMLLLTRASDELWHNAAFDEESGDYAVMKQPLEDVVNLAMRFRQKWGSQLT